VPEKLDSEPLDNHNGLSYGLFLSTNGSRTAKGSSVVDFEDGLGRAEVKEERENTREDSARRSEDARRFFVGVYGEIQVFLVPSEEDFGCPKAFGVGYAYEVRLYQQMEAPREEC